jgi:hypothetical protein
MAFQIKVNGRVRAVDPDSDTPSLWVQRDHLGLTGTKFGCGMARGSGHEPRPAATARRRSVALGGAGVRRACGDAGRSRSAAGF